MEKIASHTKHMHRIEPAPAMLEICRKAIRKEPVLRRGHVVRPNIQGTPSRLFESEGDIGIWDTATPPAGEV